MAIYTLYFCRPDGSAPTLDFVEASGDEAALSLGARRLRDHRSCDHVMVYDGDREVRPAAAPDPSATVGRNLNLPWAMIDAQPFESAIIVTGPDGRVAHWNRSAEALYGWGAHEALGQDVLHLTPARQSQRQAGEILRRLKAGRAWRGEIVLQRRSGQPFRAYVADFPLPESAKLGPLIVGASLPVERRAVVEEEVDRLLNAFAAGDGARA